MLYFPFSEATPLYEITNDEILELDRAEGRGRGYQRLEDFVVRADGNAVRVMIYMTDKTAIDTELKPYDWYLALAVNGAEENGLPGDYVAALRATLSIPDPDPDRLTHKRALTILARAEKRS